jgi:hypothetical protein
MNKIFLPSVFLLSLFAMGCKEEETIELPVVGTISLSEITSNSAIGGGSITDNGGAPITARGVCWAERQHPTTSDGKTSDGSGDGSFASQISGLQLGTVYYLRAYATNTAGTMN